MFPIFPLFPHAYDFELIQVAISITGLLFSSVWVVQCFKDVRALLQAGINGRSLTIARKNFIGSMTVGLASLVLTVMSVLLIFMEPPPPITFAGDRAVYRVAILLEIATFILNFIITIRSMLEVWLRRRALLVRALPPSPTHPHLDRRSGEDRRQS